MSRADRQGRQRLLRHALAKSAVHHTEATGLATSEQKERPMPSIITPAVSCSACDEQKITDPRECVHRPYTGPRVLCKLVGLDGNAYSIMGRVARAMRHSKWPDAAVAAYHARATAGNYDDLLAVTMEYVDEPHEEEEEEE
jgi:hypothetical protein